MASAVHRHQAQQEAQALIIPSASATARKYCSKSSLFQPLDLLGKNQGRERRIDPHRQPAFQLGWLLTALAWLKELSLFRSAVFYKPIALNSWPLTWRDTKQPLSTGTRNARHGARCLPLDLYIM